MALYQYHCEKCGDDTSKLQVVVKAPICCGDSMDYVFAPIAVIKISHDGVPVHNEGYKKDYFKDYRKSIQT